MTKNPNLRRRSVKVPANNQLARVQTLLNMKATECVISKDHTSSTSTRGPKFYDMHLDEALQLKRIEVSAHMPQLFSSLVEEELNNNADGIFKSTIRKRNLLEDCITSARATPKCVVNENDLADDYLERFSSPCATVASTLIFRQNSWTNVLIPNKTVMTNSYAQPDATLDACKGAQKKLRPNSDDIDLIQKHNLALVLWEFKSPVAADREVMESLGDLAGKDFKWSTCRGNCGDKHIVNGRLCVTGRRTSPDEPECHSVESAAIPIFENKDTVRDHEIRPVTGKRKRSSLSSNADDGNDDSPTKACKIIQQVHDFSTS